MENAVTSFFFGFYIFFLRIRNRKPRDKALRLRTWGTGAILWAWICLHSEKNT